MEHENLDSKRSDQPLDNSETLDWLESLLNQRLNYILDPVPFLDEPKIIQRRNFTLAMDADDEIDDDDASDNESELGEQFCSNCHRVEQRTRFTPVAYLMKRYPWRSIPSFLELIDNVKRGQCHYLTSVNSLVNHLLELIYRRVLAQQEDARRILARLPFRQYLYAPGMPGASRSLSRSEYDQNQVPAPADRLTLQELRDQVRRLSNRLDAVDAASILMALGHKYHLPLE